jgi:hypothetical protein
VDILTGFCLLSKYILNFITESLNVQLINILMSDVFQSTTMANKPVKQFQSHSVRDTPYKKNKKISKLLSPSDKGKRSQRDWSIP